jgi:phenylalanyl-tRNA synthetase beta chain
MKFPESWLRDLVDTPLDGQSLADALTMAGLEVEEMEAAAPPFSQVVVAEVRQVVRHPQADRLNVCQVDVGDGRPRQIVCGAPDVTAGMKVPCALPGAELPGGLKIATASVRGIESSGMLCSARELGIDGDGGGLLAIDPGLAPGTDLRAALRLDDTIFTLKLTPNRGDCLSLRGIAREVLAIAGGTWKSGESPRAVPVTIPDAREVTLGATEACPLYCGRVLRGVDAQAPTPAWMRERLMRCGLRSISALVDITNYVMLELGQPLHAFDNGKLSGAVSARMARPGETLLLLNGQHADIDGDVLVIADQEKVVALAGIMGGADSAVTSSTRDVFLESAYFVPSAVAGKARRYGFMSDASHRFERGVDYLGAQQALERASQLVIEICGGEAGPTVEARADLPPRVSVRLRGDRLRKVLGIEIADDAVGHCFDRLGLTWRLAAGVFTVTPPSYRFDLTIEEDLIEEVARLHGYHRVPTRPPRAALRMPAAVEHLRPVQRLRQTLVDRGFQEVINFAFVDARWEEEFCANPAPVRLANPIASQMAVMRSSLIGGLIANLQTNLRRKEARVRLFETGRCFHHDAAGSPVPGYRQPSRLGLLMHGGAVPEQWGAAARRVDFYDVKGEVEAVFSGRVLAFTRSTHPALHPGRAAQIILDGQCVGVVGELHPRWVQRYELESPPMVAEVDLDAALVAKLPSHSAIANTPPVVRDLALVIDQAIPFSAVRSAIDRHAVPIIRSVDLFDLYAGKGVPEGKKSLAFRVVMQDTEKTLQDAEVEEAIATLVRGLAQAVGAALRT